MIFLQSKSFKLQILEKTQVTVMEEIYWKWSFNIVYRFAKLLSLSSRWKLLSRSSLILLVLFTRVNIYFFFLSLNVETSITAFFRSFALKSSTIKDMQIDYKFGLGFSLTAQTQFYYCSLLMVQDFLSEQALVLCKIIRGLSWASCLSDIRNGKRGNDILVWKLKKAKRLDLALIFCCLDAVSSKGKENDRKKAKKLIGRLLLQRLLTFLAF